MEQQTTLGKRIAQLRKERGWTQEQLGEKVGVSAQAVSKWENDLACPDISVIPLLADLFGVTTDELLGVKPIEPHVVILDKEPEEDHGKATFELQLDKLDRWGGIALCITAILICVTLIVRSTTDLFHLNGTWSYIWPILVFGLGLLTVRKNVILGIVEMAIGAYEFIWFGWGVPFEIKWYVILLVLAVAILIRLLLEKLGVIPQKKSRVINRPESTMDYSDDGNFLKAECAFGRHSITYGREVLNGMNVETSFGDFTIDLRQVQTFANDPLLEIEVAFGNVLILLPENVRLYKQSESAFATASVKGTPSPDAAQTAYLRGEVSFGNLEIRYPNA